MAKGFKYLVLGFRSLKAVLKNVVLKKEVTVSNEVIFNRLTICKQCPSFKKESTQCNECGCFMSIKAKLADMKCPLNKWER